MTDLIDWNRVIAWVYMVQLNNSNGFKRWSHLLSVVELVGVLVVALLVLLECLAEDVDLGLVLTLRSSGGRGHDGEHDHLWIEQASCNRAETASRYGWADL